MARNQGRHRIARRTKIATAGVGLAIATGGVVVTTTTSDTGSASADAVDKSFFVDITTVRPNVKTPQPGRSASAGTFTVDCGKNENQHFNPDNFIAQPGVRNGAQHLHDYVGNLTTNADSTDDSLLAGGTTCKNGDKSAYFWPVVRIDTGDQQESTTATSARQTSAGSTQAGAAPAVDCPDVAGRLPGVPGQASAEVNDNLAQLNQQIADADQRLVTSRGQGGPDFVQNAVLGPLRDKRQAAIDRIRLAIGRAGKQAWLDRGLANCGVKGRGGNGSTTTATSASELPGVNDKNEIAGNDGEIQRPATVSLTFRGSPVTRVRAMPQFLRVLSGDAKEGTNGPANARPAWTCTGFEDRLSGKYPICPEGSKVERIHDFPSCWDGKNTDSANHRTHIVFPDENGRCGRGFVAVPQLRVTLTYDIPRAVQLAGQYKVDSFPEERHNPLSDHDDFANVMSPQLMSRVVGCINQGQTCNE
ncbi:DUF1996 domain-containing protein [Amycolatopsis alkalitolerans]|uniref:DUF1996 domain-containing protein n=1 Tax=Amycolatopsis alkalitolerans TaxID=2547244 RepID=A0A5C4M3M8_9PSEU|nr:DUF1996 domain-containing protein [Amycolatopsis alkalitolerans]TNC27676.1 DUF1996 domain-containing protein [Amycolatopsis alkalitolerans]